MRGAALLLALLAGCAAPAGTPDLAARLPAEAAGFLRGETGPPGGTPLRVEYATANRAAVATVAIAERTPPLRERDGAALDAALGGAVGSVLATMPERSGRQLAERERYELPGLRCSLLRGTFGRAPVARHVCVGATAGRLVTIEVTMADRTPPPAEAEAFARAVIASLGRR